MEADARQDHADRGKRAQGHHHHVHGAHHHAHGSHHDESMSPEEAVRSLLLLGQVALDARDYESSVEAFASALQLEPNEVAYYNLGSLYARGLAVKRDFVEAARLFHQAELMGNARAGKLCAKCMFDYLREGADDKSPADLYAEMAVFVLRAYPEATDQRQEVGRGLFAIANTHLNRGEYAQAAKAFRAAAEYACEGYAQYYLAELYHAGAGVQQNDLAALYWLDRAVDDGAADVALAERDNMLASCRQSLSNEEFSEAMATLASWCEAGTPHVPADSAKAAQWRRLA